MKTIINISKAFFFAAILMGSLSFSNQVQAGDGDTTPVQLKFIGHMQNQPVFQLDLNNTLRGDYNIVIRDANNEVIYSENLKGKKISRKYQFLSDEISAETLSFEITERNEGTSTIYNVNRRLRTVQDLVINKL